MGRTGEAGGQCRCQPHYTPCPCRLSVSADTKSTHAPKYPYRQFLVIHISKQIEAPTTATKTTKCLCSTHSLRRLLPRTAISAISNTFTMTSNIYCLVSRPSLVDRLNATILLTYNPSDEFFCVIASSLIVHARKTKPRSWHAWFCEREG